MTVLLAVACGLVGGIVGVTAYKWTLGRLEKRRPPATGRNEAYKAGYLDGLRMAAAAVPGDVDQPALKAIEGAIAHAQADEALKGRPRPDFCGQVAEAIVDDWPRDPDA